MNVENGSKDLCRCINSVTYPIKPQIITNKKMKILQVKNKFQKPKKKEKLRKASKTRKKVVKAKRMKLINFWMTILQLVQLKPLLNFNQTSKTILRLGELEIKQKLLKKSTIPN